MKINSKMILACLIFLVLGIAKASSVLPPSTQQDELRGILEQLNEDRRRLAEAIENLEESEKKLRKYIAEKTDGAAQKPNAK